jgi:hypothetical protein
LSPDQAAAAGAKGKGDKGKGDKGKKEEDGAAVPTDLDEKLLYDGHVVAVAGVDKVVSIIY